MKDACREPISFFLAFIVVLYFIVSLLSLLNGIRDAHFYRYNCRRNTPASIIVFSYKLGCWLNTEIK